MLTQFMHAYLIAMRTVMTFLSDDSCQRIFNWYFRILHKAFVPRCEFRYTGCANK